MKKIITEIIIQTNLWKASIDTQKPLLKKEKTGLI